MSQWYLRAKWSFLKELDKSGLACNNSLDFALGGNWKEDASAHCHCTDIKHFMKLRSFFFRTAFLPPIMKLV